MKITFAQASIKENELNRMDRKRKEETAEMQAATFVGVGTCSAIFQKGQSDILPGQTTEKGKSLIELQQEAGNMDVGISQDYMTLAANTLSEEDYAQMQKEGFDFGSMNSEEAVTIVDKIKAELVRSGQHIAGYTDDLDMATLSEALGSETLAKAVADSFAVADIPMTEENIAAVSVAWNQAGKLQPLSEGAYEYLIDNGLDSEIWNLYLAQNSGAGSAGNGATAKFFAEAVSGYYVQNAFSGATGENSVETNLGRQMEQVIEQSGLPVDEETKANAAWLLEKNLPLTPDTLKQMADLRKLQLPVTEQEFARAVSAAILSGKQTIHANLEKEPNLYEKAVETDKYYHSEEVWSANAGDVTARRQLEEIRLRMTAEVNVKLLKSGFSIDTEPMETLVKALRQAEQQLAEQYFPGETNALGKYETFRDANRMVAELPAMPADILGAFVKGRQDIPLTEFHGEGLVSRENYVRANEQYESLMTVPRSDLGDSIKKAFVNVDNILQDLGQEPTEENRRAVRILGYNRMEITPENIDLIQTADKQVKHVVEKLTPAATLKMIRDGVNPLEKSFGELEQYFDALPEEYRQEAESYSKFLYGLEKNNQITQEERDGFIGIYRLIRQIEKSDGAVVGALVNARAELQFSNLLSAVRSTKVKSIDAKVTDEWGGIAEVVSKGSSISEQIGRAYAGNYEQVPDEYSDTVRIMTDMSYTEEVADQYNQEQLQSMREAVLAADAECIAMLQRGQMPVNVDNLMAAQALLQDGDGAWKRLSSRKSDRMNAGEKESAEDVRGAVAVADDYEVDELWQQLEDKSLFTERYENRIQAELDAVEQETFEQADGYLDVKRMQLDHKQLNVAASMARQEEFFLPMYVGDELTKVHITFEKSEEQKGNVGIRVFLGDGSTIQAALQFVDGILQGVFAGDSRGKVMKPEQIADNFKENASEIWKLGDIRVEYTDEVGAIPLSNVSFHTAKGALSLHATEVAENPVQGTAPDNAELYRVAKVFLQSVKQGEMAYEN